MLLSFYETGAQPNPCWSRPHLLPWMLPISKDVTEVENATEWYSELQCRQLLSPATKKRYRDQVEADMSEMSRMSESEIHAVMKEPARKNRKTSVNSWNEAAIRKGIWNHSSVADPI
jgi:hypothetical protein